MGIPATKAIFIYTPSSMNIGYPITPTLSSAASCSIDDRLPENAEKAAKFQDFFEKARTAVVVPALNRAHFGVRPAARGAELDEAIEQTATGAIRQVPPFSPRRHGVAGERQFDDAPGSFGGQFRKETEQFFRAPPRSPERV